MAIPKKIHWCWLSGDPLPKNIQECVDSWKRVMPDYEFVLWDMNRFDIHSVKYVEDACAARKWACASDYIRLHALYYEGGIYLDADVMVYRRFDNLLNCSAFSGVVELPATVRLSNNNTLNLNWYLEAEMIGAEKEHPFIKACMDHYENNVTFRVNADGKVMIGETVPDVLTHVAYEYFGLDFNASIKKVQKIDAGIIIHPPKVLGCTWHNIDIKTYAAHLCMDSWGKAQRKSALQKYYDRLCAKYRPIAMLHIWRKKLAKKFMKKE